MLSRSILVKSRNFQKLFFRKLSSRVAIVGSGPAGFYTAQALLSRDSEIQVDIFEKLPLPFGLVRFGVAPDHPEVKNVIQSFTKTGNDARVKFWGNTKISNADGIPLNLLSKLYNATVLSYGCEDVKQLNLPGNNLKNVFPARDFVAWYNGLPGYSHLPIDLSNTSKEAGSDTAIVIGQGNVSIDVARIMLLSTEQLLRTDMSQHALLALQQSRIRRVLLVGRRGPAQIASTTAELREMIRIPNVDHHIPSESFDLLLRENLKSLPRRRKRLLDLMMKNSKPSLLETMSSHEHKSWQLVFQSSPISLNPSSSDPISVGSVTFCKNILEPVGAPYTETAKAVSTEETFTIPCSLVLFSIGYRGRNDVCSKLPFNEKGGHIVNLDHRVDCHLPGIYSSGWISRGSTGVIADTMRDASQAAKVILKDFQNNANSLESSMLDRHDLDQIIIKEREERGLGPVVDWNGWLKIDKEEQCNGEVLGKPREKIFDLDRLIKIGSKV